MIAVQKDLAGVQILRAAAAASVVVHHSLEMARGGESNAPDWLITATAAGVDVFFVISGFIMVLVSFPHGRPPISSGTFLIRRVTRIYPLYWMCLAILLAIYSLGGLKNLPVSPLGIFQSILLIPSDHYIVHVAWTLVYELYFYLAFAVMLPLRSPTLTAIGTSAIILVGYLISFVLPSGTLSGFLSNTIAFEFVFGLVIGLVWRRYGRWSAQPAAMIAAVAAIAIMPILDPTHPSASLDQIPRFLGWGIPAAILVASYIGANKGESRVDRLLLELGNSSYALYLTHIFGMIAYGYALKHYAVVASHPQAIIVALVSAACVGLGLITHWGVEKPLNVFIRRKIDSVARQKIATPNDVYPSAGGM